MLAWMIALSLSLLRERETLSTDFWLAKPAAASLDLSAKPFALEV